MASSGAPDPVKLNVQASYFAIKLALVLLGLTMTRCKWQRILGPQNEHYCYSILFNELSAWQVAIVNLRCFTKTFKHYCYSILFNELSAWQVAIVNLRCFTKTFKPSAKGPSIRHS